MNKWCEYMIFDLGEMNPLKGTRQSQKAFENLDKHLRKCFLSSMEYHYLFKFVSNIYS